LEIAMKSLWGQRTGLAFGALLLPFVLSAPASAAEHVDGQRMWLACENGQNYPIQPQAVSREGDLVTGYLLRTGTGRAVQLRLMPMGVGYRYAGQGIWFDGLRGTAVLNWGQRDAVSCSVMQE
jgi:hypothetical protein